MRIYTLLDKHADSFRFILRLSMVKVVLLAVLSLGMLGIVSEYVEYAAESKLLREEFVEQQKRILKAHVDRYLEEARSITTELDTALRQTAQTVSLSLYKQLELNYLANREKLSPSALRQLLLRIVEQQPQDNLARCFVYDLDHGCLFDKLHPEYQGKRVDSLFDELNTPLWGPLYQLPMPNTFIETENYWQGNTAKDSLPTRFLSVARYLEPLNWIVGVRVSERQFLEQHQVEFLERVASFRFGHSGYLFVNTLQGQILINNGRVLRQQSYFSPGEKDSWTIFLEQKRILQEQGRGYMHYQWYKLGSPSKESKIAYLDSYLTWNWIVGAGSYLDEIDVMVQRKRSEAWRALLWRSAINLTMVFVVLIGVLWFANTLSKKIIDNIDNIRHFLTQGGHGKQQIDLRQIRFHEFKRLAQVTNRAIEAKNIALLQSEQERSQFSQLFDNTPQGLLITDESLTIRRVNHYFLQLFGYQTEEIIGKSSLLLTPVERRHEDKQLLLSTENAQTVVLPYTQRLHRQGQLIDVSLIATPVFIDNRYFATYLMFLNIGEKLLVEAKLSESQYLFQLFFENAVDGFAILRFDEPWDSNRKLDLQGHIGLQMQHLRLVRYNQRIPMLLNLSEQVLADSSLSQLFGQHPTLLRRLVHQTVLQQKHRFAFYLKRSHGLHWLECHLAVFTNKAGLITGLFAQVADITLRREAELHLRKAKKKAEQADRLKTAFLSNMSHEIRTPMNAITGFADLLDQDQLSPDERHEFIAQINENSQVLLKLIEDIVDVSKIEANMLEVEHRVLDLQQLFHSLRQLALMQARALEKEHILIETEILDYTPNTFISDSLRLRQIMSNLLVNALKFTNSGNIRFGYRPLGQRVEFYVQDTGTGIPIEQQSLIFDRFVKIDSDKNRFHSGAGIGLYIARELTRLLGGNLRVSSSLGFGSRFSFDLPWGGLQNQAIQAENTASDSANYLHKTILVAEDNSINYLLIAKMLSKIGCSLLHARNGQEAVDIARQTPQLSLVLMDMQMPVLDGLEATRQIRAFAPNLPIIAQTAFSQEKQTLELRLAGCADVLYKPIDAEELLTTIHRIFEKP